RMLEKYGHTVVVAENGRKALQLLEVERFDLVLMDVHMPEMNGFQTTAAIREKERQSGIHIPIVAMTAHAMKGDRERCLDAGMDSYVAKPVQAAELQATIEALVPAANGNAEAVRTASEAENGEATAGSGVIDHAALLDRVDGD